MAALPIIFARESSLTITAGIDSQLHQQCSRTAIIFRLTVMPNGQTIAQIDPQQLSHVRSSGSRQRLIPARLTLLIKGMKEPWCPGKSWKPEAKTIGLQLSAINTICWRHRVTQRPNMHVSFRLSAKN